MITNGKTMLALTDTQLDLVTRAAAMIAVHDRCHFLRSVANRIGSLAHPSDDAIQDAVDFVLNLRGIAAGSQAFVQPKQVKGSFR